MREVRLQVSGHSGIRQGRAKAGAHSVFLPLSQPVFHHMARWRGPPSGGGASQSVSGSSEKEEGCEHWGSWGGFSGGVGKEVSDAGADRGVFSDMQGGAGTLTFSPGI